MTKYYSIEIQYSYEDFTEQEKDIKGSEAKNTIKKLALESNGDFSAFDEAMGVSTDGLTRLALTCSWKFFSLKNIKRFVSVLPLEYKILWIHNDDETNPDLTYIIYSTFNLPETKHFTQEDKDLYRVILNRLKLKSN